MNGNVTRVCSALAALALPASCVWPVPAAAAGGAVSDHLSFELPDVFGRQVRSSDYAGTPVLITFGACW